MLFDGLEMLLAKCDLHQMSRVRRALVQDIANVTILVEALSLMSIQIP